MYLRLLSLILVLYASALQSQKIDHRQGELIVQFGADVDAKSWFTAKPEITAYKALSRPLNIYLLSYDFNRHNEFILRRNYWADPAVITLQRNHTLTRRERPNDIRYNDQWHHFNVGQLGGAAGIDHNIEPAWDISTGGVTLNGDTIVVAVIDDGVDTDHEDLLPNLWVNRDEIPDNEIDDDNNGYVDDVYGYDTEDEDGDVEAPVGFRHGTSVAGIIGAKGNNALGVAGANWNVKMMIIRSNNSILESKIIAAYSYALESRQRYDITNGREGAYVVVTNSSWGDNYGDPEDSPIWCGFYDQLGEAGIINVGATANIDVNVDTEGDLPTKCPSDYLIAVTNVNAPCENFAQLLAADPAAAALRVKDAILSTTTPNVSLNGITVTGGKLNIGDAMDILVTNGGGLTGTTSSCSDCLPPSSFDVNPVAGSAEALTVEWRAVEDLSAVTLRYRLQGSSAEWTELTDVSAPYELTNLPACATYDFQVIATCPNGDGVSTTTISASTDGCCIIPPNFRVNSASARVSGDPFFQVRWSELLAGRSYRVRYRKEGTEDWLTRTAVGSQIDLAGNIDPCTNYEFEFQTI